MKKFATWMKASSIGLVVTVATFGAAAICYAQQLHTAVVILAWPFFIFIQLIPAGEPVTTGSPSESWPAIAGLAFGWLIYSSIAYVFLRYRPLAISA